MIARSFPFLVLILTNCLDYLVLQLKYGFIISVFNAMVKHYDN